MIISEITHHNKVIELIGPDHDKNENTFTLLVGRNGCGKSELLKKICLINLCSLLSEDNTVPNLSSFLSFFEEERTSNQKNHPPIGSMTYRVANTTNTIKISEPTNTNTIDLSAYPKEIREQILASIESNNNETRKSIDHYTNNIHKTHLSNHPKIIAVSASPFDKFPYTATPTYNNNIKNHYLYRGGRTQSIGSPKTYLSSKFDQLGNSLINFFIAHKNRKNEILPLLEYLGVGPNLKLTFRIGYSLTIEEIIESDEKTLSRAIKGTQIRKGVFDFSKGLSSESRNIIINSAKLIANQTNNSNFIHNPRSRDGRYTLNLNTNSDTHPPLIDAYSNLINHDLLDLTDIEFTKTSNNSPLLLTEASSGELCILFNILSIAGDISDNAVILIDEPELSLHPEWQRDFLPLLEQIFSGYKGCHFIIATHSPQIISSMSTKNSYVINLEKNPIKTISGKETNNQSSDYQLAYIFNSPGNRNEHLISKIIGVLSQITDGKKLTKEFHKEITELLAFSDLTSPNDPVHRLLSTLSKALSVISHE